MSEGFAMRWPIRQLHTVTPADLDSSGAVSDGAIRRWVSAACSEYLDRCVVVKAMEGRSGLTLVRKAGRMPGAARLGCPEMVVVSASVPEVRPESFTVAVRLRPRGGDEAGRVVETSSVVHLEDPSTGRVIELRSAVRDELIAIERSARHHN